MEPDITRKLMLVSGSNAYIDSILRCWEEDPDDSDKVLVSLTFLGQTLTSSSEYGYFDALCEIRKSLEQLKLFLICYGGSKNVFPSPMIRSMGSGEKAYKLTMGKQATNNDIVFIFDTGPDVEPSTVEDQENNYQKWLKSLQGGNNNE